MALPYETDWRSLFPCATFVQRYREKAGTWGALTRRQLQPTTLTDATLQEVPMPFVSMARHLQGFQRQ
jgi:hypothetical protein